MMKNKMEILHTFKNSYYLKMSKDKNLIAHVNSSQINIFDGQTYESIIQFKDVPNAEVFFSYDGKLLLAKNNSRKIAVYDMQKMALLKTLMPKRGSQNGDGQACFSSDNTKVINLGYDYPSGYISIFDIENGHETRLRESLGEVYSHIRYVASKNMYFIDGFQRPGKNTKDDTPNKYFYLWFDLNKDTFEQTFVDTNWVYFIYAEELEKVISYSQIGNLTLKIYPENTEIPILSEKTGMFSAVLSADNKTMAVYYQNDLKLYSFPEMKLMHSLDVNWGRVEFSSDDKEILISSNNKSFIYRL